MGTAPRWRKVDGDSDGETYGATYGRVWGTGTIDLVKIEPKAEYDGDDDDNRVYVTTSCFSVEDLKTDFTESVRRSSGLPDDFQWDDMQKAIALLEQGYYADSYLSEWDFLTELKRHTGLDADPHD